MAEKLLLRVFTHPACSGCTRAVQEAWALSQSHPVVEVRTVSLADKEGLGEARVERVKIIPTLILTSQRGELQRWEGAPDGRALEAAVSETAARA